MDDPNFIPELEPDSEEEENQNLEANIENIDVSNSLEKMCNEVYPQHPELSDDTQPSTSKKGKNIIWKKKNLVLNDIQLAFLGDTTLPLEIRQLDSPIQFFMYLFPNDLIEMIKNETNLYSIQKDPKTTFTVSTLDIRQFIGIVFFMSIAHLPRVRSYWKNSIIIPAIQETMSLNKFEKIRQLIHFSDNSKNVPISHPENDRIFKIRPVVDKLNESFMKVSFEQYLCVDEQICSTKSRNNLKSGTTLINLINGDINCRY